MYRLNRLTRGTQIVCPKGVFNPIVLLVNRCSRRDPIDRGGRYRVRSIRVESGALRLDGSRLGRSDFQNKKGLFFCTLK